MIRVHDTKQNLNTKVVLTTINCDDVYRYWNVDSIEELHRWWWDENYDGPGGDDEVVEFLIDGKVVDTNIKRFIDIADKFNFAEEVETGTFEIETESGTFQHIGTVAG